ncbi:hypothetical protein DASC09_052070 [Saccharomycopsis crataegensis]|uniref:beta-glucosidase n=1 Tax=Saccharomycopsis crataegensis TaxID=43959 RepID=A0AAV5QU08_9ASCO|nr:hypothetical protein DASC09_052070 [Saccharomycopsis crataegensis]
MSPAQYYPNLDLTQHQLEEIDNVVDRLTLSEKATLISGIDFWHTFAIHDPERNIDLPSIRMSDGPNGIRGTRFYNSVPSACLPNGTSLGATFNKELLNQTGKLMALEAKHKGAHVILGPTVNIQRGPNGGRGFESFSEDPTAAGLVASEIIKGMQSENIIATIKHYVCNDFEHQRTSVSAIVSERALREVYLKPFQLALKHANPLALMTAYNRVNGIHASQNHHLLIDILRNEWNYQGTVTSDWFGVYNLYESIKNGLDIEMPGKPLIRDKKQVVNAVMKKQISENDLDERVKNIVKLVYRTKGSGVSENGAEDTDNNTKETSEFLKRLANEGTVLLKNDANVLPLSIEDKIAVVGPNAKIATFSGGGSASLKPYYAVNAYDGISRRYGKPPLYASGAYSHNLLPGLSEVLDNTSTGNKGFRIKYYYTLEDAKANNDDFFFQDDLNESHVSFFDFTKSTKPEFYALVEGEFVPQKDGIYDFGLVVNGTGQIFIDDELIVDNKTKQTPGDMFFGYGTIEEKGSVNLSKGNKYKFRLEYGSAITSTYPSIVDETKASGGFNIGAAIRIDEEQEISNAVEVAKKVDKVIAIVGLTKEWESEGFDREDLKYPGRTNDLIFALAKANPNIIIVNQSGTPMEMPWIDDVKGVVQSWYNGMELGNSLAEVLFGDYNPSGKLPLTFPKKFEDNPAYLNFISDFGDCVYGEDIFVGYKYYEKLNKDVLFPYGFGLSYTTFEFSTLDVILDWEAKQLNISLVVENTGTLDGSEVVQVYIGGVEDSSIRRPIKELKDFTKLFVKAGEKKNTSFTTDLKNAFSIWDNEKSKWFIEKGIYQIYVGNSSANVPLSSSVSIEENYWWSGL